MSDDARESYSARESSSPPATFLTLSENESAGSFHSGIGISFSAQQDNFHGYNHFEGDNLPYSPLPDSAHPWDETQQQSCDSISVETTVEIQQQSHGSTSVETRAGSQDGSTSRLRCDKCNKSFTDNNGLKRHVETIHEHGHVDWVCTVKGCRKYKRKVSRKDNFRRHCKRKHPTVDIKHFGL